MNSIERIFRSVSSFRNKQRLVIMLACFIVLSVSLGSTLVYETISFNRDSRTRLVALADIVAADISAAVVFGDAKAIDNTLQSLTVDQTITQLFVLDAQGKLAGSYIRGNRQPAAGDVEHRVKKMRQEGSQTVFELSPRVNRPIMYDGDNLGSILVELDRNVLISKLFVSARIGMVILLFSLLGSYLLARKLGKIVTDPVQMLVATMQEVTRTKNYHVRADVHGVTELALLAEGFNEMLGVIAQRDEALQESEYRWKFAIEGSGDGVWDWNIQTDEVKYSKRWKEMLGYAEDEIQSTNQEWIDRIHPEDQSYVAGAMQAYLAGRMETYIVEYRLRCKNGRYKWILGRGMVVSRSEDGKPLRMIGTHNDITERRQAEEELRKKNAEIEQFLYTVSHDLRTPLVTVKTFLGFLENDMAGNDQIRVSQDLQFIHGAADKMKMLLDELLEMSRIDRVESPPVSVSLMDILAEVLGDMAGAITERKVEIQLPESDLLLFGDRSRLCQIWQNLIENAIKYSRDDSIPRIELGLRQLSAEAVFFVKDNGIGIEPQYCSKIFGIFEKLDPKSSGVGLGLSMLLRIVEKSGGRIWVESEGLGKGSCFHFTLPHAVVQS